MDESMLLSSFDNKEDICTRQVHAFLWTSAQYLGLNEVPGRLPADHWQGGAGQATPRVETEHFEYRVRDNRLGGVI
jgi:hypothetical protein